MLETEHPSHAQLEAYRLGRLDEEQATQLQAHITQCDLCAQSLDKMRTPPNAHDHTPPPADETLAPGHPSALGQFDLSAELIEHPRYHVQELLGRGGMGAVYRAEHRLMERRVALKVINPELMKKPAAVERFRREVKAAAKLVHQNIVTAFDAEQAGDCHFLVMEFVPGTTLARLVAEKGPLPVEAACDYIRQAARGMQLAYEHNMVHRDIKPQNLMLTPEGRIKILDFGLARFVSESSTVPDIDSILDCANDVAAFTLRSDDDTTHADTSDPPIRVVLGNTEWDSAVNDEPPTISAPPPTADHHHGGPLTVAGTIMGSPDYIAPEQVVNSHAADIRADIYSLGCTFYFLLAGQVPFPKTSFSEKLAAHRQLEPMPLGEIRRDIPPPLLEIIDRMTTKDPMRRYQTPAQVADALTPFIHQTANRRRWLPMLAAALLLVAGLSVVGYFFGSNLLRLATNKGELFVVTDDPEGQIIVTQAGERVEVIDLKKDPSINLPAGDYHLQLSGARNDLRLQPDKIVLERGGNVTVAVRQIPDYVGEIRRFDGKLSSLWSVAFSPEGRYVLTGGTNGVVKLWDVRSGLEVRDFRGHSGQVWAVAFSADGTRAVSGADDKTVRLWDVSTGRELLTLPKHENGIRTVAISPDGQLILAGENGPTIYLWETATGREVWQQSDHKGQVHTVAFSPDGKLALSTDGIWNMLSPGVIRIWDVATGAEVHRLTGHRLYVSCAAFSPDGKRIISGSRDGTLRLWDVERGRELYRILSGMWFESVSFAPDGRRAVTGGREHFVHLWDVSTKQMIRRFEGHSAAVVSVKFSPDGEMALSGSWDGTMRLWRLPPAKPVQ